VARWHYPLDDRMSKARGKEQHARMTYRPSQTGSYAKSGGWQPVNWTLRPCFNHTPKKKSSAVTHWSSQSRGDRKTSGGTCYHTLGSHGP